MAHRYILRGYFELVEAAEAKRLKTIKYLLRFKIWSEQGNFKQLA